MLRTSRLFLATFFILALVSAPATSLAQKSKGGGPTGIIYFRHDGSMWQMDPAGTPASRIRLPLAPDYGEPSHKLHGDRRWFVYGVSYVPELAPVFPNQRQFTEICVGDTSGASVILVSDISLEIISEPRWSADDLSITFIAERWADEDGQRVAVNAGAFRLAITFAVDGTPQAGSLTFLIDLSIRLRGGPAGVPGYSDLEFCGLSSNKAGTQLAFGIRIDSDQERSQEIWISDLLNGTDRLLVSGNGVGWPEWSPDDRRLAFNRDGQVVYDLATGRTKSLNRSAIDSWGGLRWAPSGAYAVVYHWDNLLPGYDALYRCTADLGGRTELTAGLAEPLRSFNYFIPVGWRN